MTIISHLTEENEAKKGNLYRVVSQLELEPRVSNSRPHTAKLFLTLTNPLTSDLLKCFVFVL